MNEIINDTLPMSHPVLNLEEGIKEKGHFSLNKEKRKLCNCTSKVERQKNKQKKQTKETH